MQAPHTSAIARTRPGWRAIAALALLLALRGRALAQADTLAPLGNSDGAEQADAPSTEARERARQLYEQASQAHEAGDYAAAIAALQEAHAAYPSTRFVFNIAQAQRQLGDCSAARQSYLDVLAADGDPELRARATVGLELLEGCRPPPGPARHEVSSAPDQAVPEPPADTSPAAPAARSPWVWVGWTASGALAASTAVTGGMLIAALYQLGDLEETKPADPDAVDAAEQRAHKLAIATDVLAAATLVGASLSLYWTVREGRGRRAHVRSALPPERRLSVTVSCCQVGFRLRY